MTPRFTLSQEYLRSRLSYNPVTGEFTWLARPREHFKTLRAMATWNARFAGRVAGSKAGRYQNIVIDYCTYQAHRLAWFFVHGVWPDHIDHGDGATRRNVFDNLRSVTNAENRKNQSMRKDNKSGVHGVCWVKGKWRASIQSEGKSIYLGRFANLEDAAAARAAAEVAHGFHPNHGRPAR